MDIDFVITWVDNEDPQWQAAFRQWLPANTGDLDTGEERYRDWHLLRYWFRGVERFAPWVNKVHFVTNGQLPSWLNIHHPKLHIVRHSDIMPADSLPTFNSNAIEMCIDRIEGLSENFVYFNDDVFLVGDVNQNYFFRNGLPCDVAVTRWHNKQEGIMNNIVNNNLRLLNAHFRKYTVMLRHARKWFTLAYGYRNVLENLLALLQPKFASFLEPHSALPMQRHTLAELRNACEEQMNQTASTRFRSSNDISPWLYRYWRLCRGEFTPFYPDGSFRVFCSVEDELPQLHHKLLDPQVKIVVINDAVHYTDFYRLRERTAQLFAEILPEASSFEHS